MSSEHGRRASRVVAALLLSFAMLAPGAVMASAQTSSTGTLHVGIDGWGSGRVTSSPSGIDCRLVTVGDPYDESSGFTQTISGSCQATFPVGRVVTMTATPDAGSVVNGLDCGGRPANPCRQTTASGYNAVWSMFCPRNGLCSAG